MRAPASMIAQSVDTWSYAAWIIVTCLILLVGAITLYVGVVYYRRRWLDSGSAAAEPWTLADLRKMREQGDLTEEEYQAMRSAVIKAVGGQEVESSRQADAGDDGAQGRRF